MGSKITNKIMVKDKNEASILSFFTGLSLIN